MFLADSILAVYYLYVQSGLYLHLETIYFVKEYNLLIEAEIKIFPVRATLDSLLVHSIDSDLLECTKEHIEHSN